MELIDKDKIKAEVEKKIHGEQGYSSGDVECGYRDCARDILSFLDTLETKEEEDSFIEKAWDWIEDNLLSANQQDKSRLYFEQFVNYMKGE